MPVASPAQRFKRSWQELRRMLQHVTRRHHQLLEPRQVIQPGGRGGEPSAAEECESFEATQARQRCWKGFEMRAEGCNSRRLLSSPTPSGSSFTQHPLSSSLVNEEISVKEDGRCTAESCLAQEGSGGYTGGQCLLAASLLRGIGS
ncbi:unnamed protein product [Closterium sp. NIES-54]